MNTTIEKFLIFLLIFVVGVSIGALIEQENYFNHPERVREVEKLLDKDKYTIDTIITIHESDTMYKYKFIKIKKQ